ncbi:hypothetical protein SDC9_171043 [bioreactor metagenome]|uniref:RNA polymerase sigma factor 70 region 4 type 2 domain-containing protein n=1 Tax=bioreactor metagenome TaxID=1076179 RepID=A0A645GC55_9ZZZZ
MFCSDNIDLSLKSDSYISFENEILASEDKKALHNSIDKLRDDYSTVLHLIYFEEMSYAQAGAVMNKSRKQVENLVMRARTTLRILLEKEGYSK